MHQLFGPVIDVCFSWERQSRGSALKLSMFGSYSQQQQLRGNEELSSNKENRRRWRKGTEAPSHHSTDRGFKTIKKKIPLTKMHGYAKQHGA